MVSRIFLFIIAGTVTSSAMAADRIHTYPIDNVLKDAQYSSKWAGVKFFFEGMPTPPVQKDLGSVRTSQRTNGFNKSDLESCQRVMANALIYMANEAKAAGGNAVIHIKSNWKDNPVASATEFTCAAGGLMSGVALIGQIAKIPG
jgi:hypothetical protein